MDFWKSLRRMFLFNWLFGDGHWDLLRSIRHMYLFNWLFGDDDRDWSSWKFIRNMMLFNWLFGDNGSDDSSGCDDYDCGHSHRSSHTDWGYHGCDPCDGFLHDSCDDFGSGSVDDYHIDPTDDSCYGTDYDCMGGIGDYDDDY